MTFDEFTTLCATALSLAKPANGELSEDARVTIVLACLKKHHRVSSVTELEMSERYRQDQKEAFAKMTASGRHAGMTLGETPDPFSGTH